MGLMRDIQLGLIFGVVGAAALSVPGCVIVVHDDDEWDEDSYVSQERPKRIGVETATPGSTLSAQLDLNKDKSSVVTRVIAGSPAETGGLRKNDVITSIDGSPDADSNDLRRAVRSKEPGETLTLGVIREGKPIEVVVIIEANGWQRPTMNE